MKDNDGVTLASALFQSALFLESAHPIGSQERLIAEICWQASKALEPMDPMVKPIATHLGLE